LSTKTDNLIPVRLPSVEDVDAGAGEPRPFKKEFVEPEVSFPVDVLEATTFFQLTDSGSTT
jgi:hypothetical protein